MLEPRGQVVGGGSTVAVHDCVTAKWALGMSARDHPDDLLDVGADAERTIGFRLSPLPSAPVTGFTLPPRTMYLSVRTLTRISAFRQYVSSSRTISSRLLPAATASAARSTISPSEAERWRESTTEILSAVGSVPAARALAAAVPLSCPDVWIAMIAS
jgi:hypothetical protein